MKTIDTVIISEVYPRGPIAEQASNSWSPLGLLIRRTKVMFPRRFPIHICHKSSAHLYELNIDSRSCSRTVKAVQALVLSAALAASGRLYTESNPLMC